MNADKDFEKEGIAQFKLPCKYFPEGQMIFDADNQLMLDVRAWGFLQYKPDGEKLQDGFGRYVAKAINELESKSKEVERLREDIKIIYGMSRYDANHDNMLYAVKKIHDLCDSLLNTGKVA